jgi:HK97 family phage major capsid protein
MTDSRRIIEKADLAVSQMISDGGYLNPEQSDSFYRKLIDQPTLISQVRTVSMGQPKMNIDKIGFGSRILRAAPASGTSLKADERARPTFDQVQLDAEEVIAEVHVPYDALEDSIEKENLQDTIMDLIAQRASLDLEELLIKGDTTSNDPYLALFNGALALAGNTVDGSAYTAIDKTVFKTALQNMPTQYLRNLNTMQFMMSYNNVFEYRDQLADRATGKGDDFYLNRPTVYAFGVPIAPAALMEDTDMLFTFPKNLIFGVQRDIMIETDKDIRSRVLIIVLTMRIALEIEEAEAAVRVSDLAVV